MKGKIFKSIIAVFSCLCLGVGLAACRDGDGEQTEMEKAYEQYVLYTIGDSAFFACTSLTSVYYKGTAEEWANITIDHYNSKLTNATRYYYIENEADVPTDEGNYWHYDENGEIAVW